MQEIYGGPAKMKMTIHEGKYRIEIPIPGRTVAFDMTAEQLEKHIAELQRGLKFLRNVKPPSITITKVPPAGR